MTRRYLLDTNICIYIIKNKPIGVLSRFQQLTQGEVVMSVISFGELMTGVCKSQHPGNALQKLIRLQELIPIEPMTAETGKHYGEIRASLEKRGTTIGNNDLWIAAHALATGLILVTNNCREFERVPGLVVENWV